MFEAGFFVETFLPLFMLSAYKNFVHGKSIEPRSEAVDFIRLTNTFIRYISEMLSICKKDSIFL